MRAHNLEHKRKILEEMKKKDYDHERGLGREPRSRDIDKRWQEVAERHDRESRK